MYRKSKKPNIRRSLKLTSSKKSQHIDLVSDVFMFGLVIFILIVAIILSKSYSKSVTTDLVQNHMKDITLNYNLMNALRMTDSNGKYVSDIIRDFCNDGEKEKLETELNTDFLKIMIDGERYKLSIDGQYCNGHDFEQTVKKGDAKRRYLVLSANCNVLQEKSILIPDYDKKPILIKVQNVLCDT